MEAHHFDIRKGVLQYDDVLSTQREVIYRERRRILERADLRSDMENWLEEHLDIILGYTYRFLQYHQKFGKKLGLPEVLQTLSSDIPMLSELKTEELTGLSFDESAPKNCLDDMLLAYKVREEHLGT